MAARNTTEQSSLSNYRDARVTSLDIEWSDVNFEKSTLSGSVKATVLIVAPTREVILDTKSLEVVSCLVNG